MTTISSGNITITLAITGASGAVYGMRLLECLIQAQCQVYFMLSKAGRLVLNTELDLVLPAKAIAVERVLNARFAAYAGQLQVFGLRQWMAPVASGSSSIQAMVICPCSMGTLGNIAAGLSANLIDRAAAVMLKERRKLILVVRETPLSALHLENMLRLSQLGVIILPACPGFYFKPQSIADLVDFIVARVLDHLNVAHEIVRRWNSVVPS